MRSINNLFAILTVISYLLLAVSIPRAIMLLDLRSIQLAGINVFAVFWLLGLFKATYQKE